ncbi:MAG: transglycosylase family protein [Acidimicrobiales bacterium]
MSRRDRSGERATPTVIELPGDERPSRPLALRITMLVVLVVPLLVAGVIAIAGRSTDDAGTVGVASPTSAEPVRVSFEAAGAPKGKAIEELAWSSSSTSTTSAPASSTTESSSAPSTTAAPATTATTAAAPTTTAPTATKAQAVPAAPAAPPTTAAPKPVATTPPTTAAPKPVGGSSSDMAFLACVRQRESGGNYGIDTGNGYYGAYQFAQSTWDNTARHAGRGDLVGRKPSQASPGDQDAMALHLLQWVGRSPWAGYGC